MKLQRNRNETTQCLKDQFGTRTTKIKGKNIKYRIKVSMVVDMKWWASGGKIRVITNASFTDLHGEFSKCML